jgi:hypothetical protein
MTVDSAYYIEQYLEDGEFNYPFQMESIGVDAVEVYVISSGVRTLLPSTEYTIEFGYRNPVNSGGKVVLNAALADGEILQIERATPITNDQVFAAGKPFDAEAFEYAIDKLTFILQELEGSVCDCRPAKTTPGYPGVIADPTDPAGPAYYRWLRYIGVGLDPTSSNGTFIADMPVNEEVPAGWIVVVAVNSKNTIVNTVGQPIVDGVNTVSMGGYFEQAQCGQPGGNNWEHSWRAGYLSAPWAGGVLGSVTAFVDISDQTRAFVWAFDPRGFSVDTVSAAMARSTESATGTATNSTDKTIHVNIANSTDSSLTAGVTYSETGTAAPDNVQIERDGADATTQAYPMMLIDRVDTQPSGGVPWQVDIPGSNTGFGYFEWAITLV